MTVAMDDENAPGVIPPTPLQAKKIETLEAAIPKLQEKIKNNELAIIKARERLNELIKEHGGPPDAAGIVKEHIRLLHDYNEIKDVGQGLIGLIAQSRGVRHIEVQTEFGIATAD
ncbi:DNA repair protein Swi5/Sae3 [Trichophyton interdigitale]|nr:DNA repair protein Swi5/Sae3 [Trichophyton interdigitale]KAG5217836.1 DNA repair protein Swi5/Sae3 [Trichophyton interdigitale]KAG8206284.1 DNA repair protein Swi5/Sae3 [Trichophyton interdigitale]